MNFYRNPGAIPAWSGQTAAPAAAKRGPLLAVPYVRPQEWETVYAPAKALMRGTVFPCLDLPFLGKGGARK